MAGEGGAPSSSSNLAALASQLSRPDAITDLDVLETLGRYVQGGGEVKEALRLLSEGYRGFGPMVSLVCGWHDVAETASRSLKEAVLAKSTLRERLGRTGRERALLERLIEDQFCPEKADLVFSKGAGAPKWLFELIASKEGRNLVYRLADKHKSSTLLKFALQLIWQDGKTEEMAQMTSSAAHFGVFQKVLESRLEAFASADCESDAIEGIAVAITTLCCTSEEAFVYCLCLVSEVIRVGETEATKQRFRWLGQKLEDAALATHGAAVFRLRAATVGRSLAVEDSENHLTALAASTIADVLTAAKEGGSTGRIPLADLKKLSDIYASREPPAFEMLHTPAVLHALMDELFSPAAIEAVATGRGTSERQDVIRQLLSLVTVTRTMRGGNSRSLSLNYSDYLNVDEADRNFRQVQDILTDVYKRDEIQVTMLHSAIKTSYSAMSLLYFVKKWMAKKAFSDDSMTTSCCTIAHELARASPVYHQDLLDGFISALESDDIDDERSGEVERRIFDEIVFLALMGFHRGVLDWMEEWARRSDPVLVKYALTNILNQTKPPFSPYYIGKIEKLISISGLPRQSAGLKRFKEVSQARRG